MEKEINVKHFIAELKRKTRPIMAISLVVAILFCVYYVYKINKENDAQLYGAYGEIYIEGLCYNNIDDTSSDVDNVVLSLNNDLDTAQIAEAVMLSDQVISKVSEDINLTKNLLSNSELRKMIHLEVSEKGSVVSVYVTGSEEGACQLICESLLMHGTEYFSSLGYDTKVLRKASEMGAVSIDIKESSQNEGKLIYNINEVEISKPNISGIIKNFVLGVIVGIIFVTLFFYVKFIMNDKISCIEQIQKKSIDNAISKDRGTDISGELISSIFMDKNNISIVDFLSLKQASEIVLIVKDLAKKLNDLNNNVLIIEYCNNKGKEFVDKSDKNFNYIKKDYIHLDLLNLVEEYEKYKQEYNYILICTDNIYENPIGKAVASLSDIVNIIIPNDSITVADFESVVDSVKNAGVKKINGILI